MKLALVVFVLGLSAPALAAGPKPAAAQKAASSPAKLEKIRKLLKTTHADAPLNAMMDAARAQMPPAQFAELQKRVKTDEILDLVAAAYDRHFTEKDVDGLLAFYETPLGKKLIAEGPAVQRESSDAARDYFIKGFKDMQQAAQQPAQDVPAKSP